MTAMPSEQPKDDLVALVRERQNEGEAATRSALLTEGHDPKTVETALVHVYGLKVHAAPAEPSATTNVVVVTIVVLLVNVAALISLITVSSMFFSLIDVFGGDILAFTIPIIGVVAVEGGAIRYMRGRNPVYARGMTWALGITVGVILVLLALLLALIAYISSLDFQ